MINKKKLDEGRCEKNTKRLLTIIDIFNILKFMSYKENESDFGFELIFLHKHCIHLYKYIYKILFIVQSICSHLPFSPSSGSVSDHHPGSVEGGQYFLQNYSLELNMYKSQYFCF